MSRRMHQNADYEVRTDDGETFWASSRWTAEMKRDELVRAGKVARIVKINPVRP